MVPVLCTELVSVMTHVIQIKFAKKEEQYWELIGCTAKKLTKLGLSNWPLML